MRLLFALVITLLYQIISQGIMLYFKSSLDIEIFTICNGAIIFIIIQKIIETLIKKKKLKDSSIDALVSIPLIMSIYFIHLELIANIISIKSDIEISHIIIFISLNALSFFISYKYLYDTIRKK